MKAGKTIICVQSAILFQGLSFYLQSFTSKSLLHSAPTAGQLVRSITNEHTVAFIDPEMLSKPARATLSKIRNHSPDCKIVCICPDPLPNDLIPYFDETILINNAEDEILQKLRKIYQPDKRREEIQSPLLSGRESEILKWVALGLTNKEIANKLFISIHTVIAHRKNITSRLGIKTIAGLAVYAVLNGIIDVREMKG